MKEENEINNQPETVAASAERRSFWKSFKGDKVIWRIVIALSIVSLLAIYSSTGAMAYLKGQTTFGYLIKQLIFVLASMFVVYVAHNISIIWYRRLAKLIFFTSIILLLLTFVVGVTLNEGSRWLRIPVIGLTFQPADIAKIGLILYIAKVFEEGGIDSFKQFFLRILTPIAVACVLILWGSTSAAILLGFSVFILLFVAGVRNSYLWKTLGIACAAIAVIVTLGYTTPYFPRIETAVNRVVTYTKGDDNTEKDKAKVFQSEQSSIAIATGGIIGKGPGNSTQRHVLPHPYSDFVYAIIIEEYGLVGGFIVLFLYLILLYRAVVIARSCTKIFPALTVLGLMMLTVFQAMINMCVAVGIFPVTGQTLPFISLGGSSLVTMGFAMGIILSISRATEERDMSKVAMKAVVEENQE